ncbi:hypothetical protein PEC301875_07150 [Pectobacterium carotovorum subsp. carotovorum]|nr:hypothetical protein PEC301875_07150 [Pectobacterium carotovorum subsp. carotovorum]
MCLWRTLASNETVSVKCWRRISIQHNSWSAERATSSPEKTFKHVALDWHKSNRTWSENHAARLLASMNNHIFPIIGHLPVTELKTRHVIDLLKGIEKKGLLEVTARVFTYLFSGFHSAYH